MPDREGVVEVTHVSPSASLPENVEKAERATVSLQQGNLWARAAKALEVGEIADLVKMTAEIELARKLDSDSLYVGDADNDKEMRRGAVAAMAAVTLEFRQDRSAEELHWARGALWRAKDAPDTRGAFWCAQSVIPWHPGIFIARGLAADLRHGTANKDAPLVLLALAAHPLEAVSLTALGQTGKLWNVDPKLVWAALHLGFTLCVIEPQRNSKPRGPSDPTHPPARTKKALSAAVKYYRKGSGWPELPLPPPAWIEVKANGKPGLEYSGDIDFEDLEEPKKNWADPDTHWYSQYAAKVLKTISFEEILASEAKEAMLRFVAGILKWTNAKNAPPWIKKGRRDRESSRLFEWTHQLGSTLGRISGLLPAAEAKSHFLDPIFSLEGDTCWALLEPYVSTYTCRYVYDAQVVPEGAVEILNACLQRLLKSGAFIRGSYSAGKFYGFDQPQLLESLMFVFAQYPALGAARFANGNWSEIGLIIPIVDRFVRAGGWASTVMSHFLTLCERARDTYPAELFGEQILAIIGDGTEPLSGWHGSFIPARIAGLVQHFASRDTPLPLQVAQKLLRILDLLVDMGDRRSAALQLGESFREIKAA